MPNYRGDSTSYVFIKMKFDFVLVIYLSRIASTNFEKKRAITHITTRTLWKREKKRMVKVV